MTSPGRFASWPFMAAVSLLLGGCWEGARFYAPSDASVVLAPGRYNAIEPDGRHEILEFSARGDGMIRLVTRDEVDQSYGIAPLGGAPNRFVIWSEDFDDEGHPVSLFALLQRLGTDEFLLYLPSCSGHDAEVAEAVGATRSASPAASCHFRSRAQLESALRRLDLGAGESIRLVRLPEGSN